MSDPNEALNSPAGTFLQGLIHMAERAVDETLGQERSRAAAIELSDRVLRIVSATLPLIESMHPPAQPIACRSGCTHCCRLPIVMTDVPTVFRLGFHTASQLPHNSMHKVATALQGSDRPCAFLIDDACSIYHERPVVCRAYNAFDVSNCAEGRFMTGDAQGTGLGLADPWPYGVGAAAQQGMAAGLDRLGIDSRQVQMIPALRFLSNDLNAADRWLRGEPAFESLVEIH